MVCSWVPYGASSTLCAFSPVPGSSLLVPIPGALAWKKWQPPCRGRLSCLSRPLEWWSLQPVLVTQYIAVVLVRTKKRFIPPTCEPKYESEKEFIECPEGGTGHASGTFGASHTSDLYSWCLRCLCSSWGWCSHVISFKGSLTQSTEQWKKNVASQLSVRKIKEYDANFKTKDFPEKARDIFMAAHIYLNNLDHDWLHTLVTNHCFLDVVWDIKHKPICQNFVESLEPLQWFRFTAEVCESRATCMARSLSSCTSSRLWLSMISLAVWCMDRKMWPMMSWSMLYLKSTW